MTQKIQIPTYFILFFCSCESLEFYGMYYLFWGGYGPYM